jgi:hypothetical protein
VALLARRQERLEICSSHWPSIDRSHCFRFEEPRTITTSITKGRSSFTVEMYRGNEAGEEKRGRMSPVQSPTKMASAQSARRIFTSHLSTTKRFSLDMVRSKYTPDTWFGEGDPASIM